MLTTTTREFIAILLFTFISQGRRAVSATCFFPPEYTGEFVMQKSVNVAGSVEYSTINISFIGTPLWGNCSKQIENHFIFSLSNDDNPCLRCLYLNLKSKNVLQVRSANFSRCYTEERDVIASCPTERGEGIDEIILFKVAELSGYPAVKEYCPLGDRYTLSYRSEGPNAERCTLREANMNTCASGAVMNVQFEQCNGTSFDFKLSCIGRWKGPQNQMFLALEDTRKKPTYRCALYEENKNGEVRIALSKDSTCDVELHSATQGHETLTLTPIPHREVSKWSDEIETSECKFPQWLQGEWEHVKVDGMRFYYKDQADFITFDLKCLSNVDKDKYIVYSRTHCDEKSYNCLWIRERDPNVFEFQTGGRSSKYRTEHLCDPSNAPEKWITQSRKRSTSEVKCPISGVFKGMIPETQSLCSNLSSDCVTPDLMYYKVFSCDTMQMLEEREYRCLGHWMDDKLLYTYTKRHDQIAEGSFECFVGSIVSDNEDYIIIKEAGEHCQRSSDALTSGMKLIKQKELMVPCVGNESDVSIDKMDENYGKKTYYKPVDKDGGATNRNVYNVTLGNNEKDIAVRTTGGEQMLIPLITIYLLSITVIVI